MPQYLRTSTVRLLESSQEALALALVGLGIPSRGTLRVEAVQFAAPVGLIGAAAEQALSALLVQVRGDESLMASATQFKSAREILRDVRDLLRAPVPRASFLSVGVGDPIEHRNKLIRATEGLSLLFSQRAAGFHAGRGPARAVALVQASKVVEFLDLIAESFRVRPYLERVPRPPEEVVDRNVLIDDLARKFQRAETASERSDSLRSLFLVLPEIPAEAPDWLDAFDRSAVAPTNEDINLLLGSLERADPVRFQRLNAGGQGLNVVVRPQDPNALPIAPQHLRRAFGDIADQFAADVGNANGRLDAGTLDLPPEGFLLDLCVLGPEQLRQVFGRQTLTAHEVWPFVATALSQQGTERPFWFLVSMTDDLGQLVGQVRRAFQLAQRQSFRQREASTLAALEALRLRQPLAPPVELAVFARTEFGRAERIREGLVEAIERSRETERAASAELEAVLPSVAAGDLSPGHVFDVVTGMANLEARRYWARVLAEAATNPEDRGMLAQILRLEDFVPARTAARKAFKLIDAIAYGPQVELE